MRPTLWGFAIMVGDLHQPLHFGATYFADTAQSQSTPKPYRGRKEINPAP